MNNRETIIKAVESLPGDKKYSGSWLMIQCPFHDDRVPSSGVYISLENIHKLGNFSCFGCGVKLKWNEFAEKLQLPVIAEWKNSLITQDINIPELDYELLTHNTTKHSVFKKLNTLEAQPWPESLDWRGFSGKLINKVGGYIAKDSYKDTIQLVFLININNEIRGGIKAKYSNSRVKYLTMPGNWVLKWGLLFYEQAESIIAKKGYDFIVLVEGPRDALRLINNGIPAVAALGAGTMTDNKYMLLNKIACTVVVLPDNDEGGNLLWNSVKHYPSSSLVRLPKSDKKIDPASMDRALLMDFFGFLKKFGFKPPKQVT